MPSDHDLHRLHAMLSHPHDAHHIAALPDDEIHNLIAETGVDEDDEDDSDTDPWEDDHDVA